MTGIGQLRNIQSFIDQYNAANNIAIVLYTDLNTSVLETVKNNIDHDYFNRVYYYKLPRKLLEEKIAKSRTIYAIFEEAIDQAVGEHHIQNVFICMPNSHYSFFESICRKRNLSINLIEEGLATYRIYQQEIDTREYKLTGQDLFISAKHVWKSFIDVLKRILIFFKALVHLGIDIVTILIGRNITHFISAALRSKQKYRYSLITKFDNIYVCYPELMSKLNPEAKRVLPLRFDYTDVQEKFTSDDDAEHVLFINQKYGIPYKVHFPVIFSILQEMGITKIYMKFHPKEDLSQMMNFFNEAIEQFPDLQVIPLVDLYDMPVENLLNAILRN